MPHQKKGAASIHLTSSFILAASRDSIDGPRSVSETGGRADISSGKRPSIENDRTASLSCRDSIVVAMASS